MSNTPRILLPPALANGGYFGLAHRNTVLAHDRRRLNAYIARFKHALLFNPKLVIADHMVVNGPNLRAAYHSDSTFKELMDSDFIELAHFEVHKNGNFMSLPELRDFYQKAGNAFYPSLPRIFQNAALDSELETIQSSVTRRFPPSARRDPLFTQFAHDALENPELKSLFAKRGLYGAYETAFRLMIEDYPILGIIHFDPEHRFVGDKNIFDYMAHLSSMRLTRHELIRQFGDEVARAHRALLIKVETQLLDVPAILPVDLIKYRTLVLKTAHTDSVAETDREVKRVPVDLSAVGIPALASLTTREMRNLRNSEPAQQYFRTITEDAPFDSMVEAVHNYARYLNITLSRKSFPSARGPIRSSIGVLRGVVLNESGHMIGINTIIDIIAAGVSYFCFGFNPVAAIKALVSAAEGKIGMNVEGTNITSDVKAVIEQYPDAERLMQYE